MLKPKAWWISLVCGVSCVAPAEACWRVPDASIAPLEEYLSQADGIYLALLTQVSLSDGIETSWTPPDEAGSIGEVLDRVQSAARARVEYAFQVLEVIEGNEQETLQIAMPFRPAVGSVSDFSGHTDPDFWTNPQSGRAVIGGNCRVVTDFQLGATYVLITSDVWHVKSFERVQSPDDRFYRYLLDRVEAE